MAPLDPELLEVLRCPDSHHAELTVLPADDYLPEGGLQCSECRRVFPIREGIPVLLLDDALPG